MIWSSLMAAALLAGAPPAGPGVRFESSLDAAFKRARQLDKPLMVDFWAEWCGWCRRLDQTTYVDPLVTRLAAEFVAVKVNTEGGQRELKAVERYRVSSLPTIAFLSPEGHLILRVNGFQGPGSFPDSQRRALRLAEDVLAWERRLRRDSGDAEALAELGWHLYKQEAYDDSRQLLERAARRDQHLRSVERKRTRLALGAMAHEQQRYSQAEDWLYQALDLRPPDELDARALFVLGRTYLEWKKPAEAGRVLKRLLSEHPSSPVAQKARESLVQLERRAP